MKNVNLVMVVVVGALLGAVLSNCGPTAAACSSRNCAGCCTSFGECIPSTTAQQCGTLGNACTSCLVGQTCSLGFCTSVGGTGGGTASTGGGSGGGSTGGGTGGGGGSQTTCSPGNCNGCCTASGTCSTAGTAQQCGTNGAACMVCSGTQTCSSGVCVTTGTGGGGGTTAPGTCADPTTIPFVNDSFESNNFLMGTSQWRACSVGDGPEGVFEFSFASPGYLFAAVTGSATVAPALALVQNGTCSTATAACRYSATNNQTVGIPATFLSSGTHGLIVDSYAGTGGSYSLVVNKSATTGDTCADARTIVMSGTRAVAVGSLTSFASDMSSCVSGTYPDAFYRFVPTRTGSLTVSARTQAEFVAVSMWNTPTCAGRTTDLACEYGAAPSFTRQVTAGQTYWIRVGSVSSPSYALYVLALDMP